MDRDEFEAKLAEKDEEIEALKKALEVSQAYARELHALDSAGYRIVHRVNRVLERLPVIGSGLAALARRRARRRKDR